MLNYGRPKNPTLLRNYAKRRAHDTFWAWFRINNAGVKKSTYIIHASSPAFKKSNYSSHLYLSNALLDKLEFAKSWNFNIVVSDGKEFRGRGRKNSHPPKNVKRSQCKKKSHKWNMKNYRLSPISVKSIGRNFLYQMWALKK